MPTLPAKEFLPSARTLLGRIEELQHIRPRARGALVVLESGPEAEPVRHARFRRVTKQYWMLEMPASGGRWQPTGYRDTLGSLFELLVGTCQWV